MPEARLIETDHGKVAEGDGWFVVNARECRWFENEKFGSYARLEGDKRFEQIGAHFHLLQPSQPNCHYHRESEQENFLVLSGECLLIVEGKERLLKTWDFVHCPPHTDHVFVGAGDQPCLLFMFGARNPEGSIHYPLHPVPQKWNACAEEPTDQPAESYKNVPSPQPLTGPPEAARQLLG